MADRLVMTISLPSHITSRSLRRKTVSVGYDCPQNPSQPALPSACSLVGKKLGLNEIAAASCLSTA
jgi:hypothetical protein